MQSLERDSRRTFDANGLGARAPAECPPRVLFLASADLAEFSYVSPSFEDLFGLPTSTLLAQPGSWIDAVHHDDRSRFTDALSSARRAGQCTVKFRLARPDGDVRNVRCEMAVRRGAVERAAAVLGIFEDLTNQPNDADLLAANEHRLKTIVNNTPSVAIQAYDIDGRVVMWNVAAAQVFGWPEREAIGQTLDELILDEKSFRKFVALLRQMDRTGEPVGPMEWDFRRRDGSRGTVYSTIFSVQQRDGSRLFVCMDVDITDRKSTEAALSTTLRLNQQIIEAIPGGVVHISPDGRVYRANGAAVAILGLPHDELTRRSVQDFAGATFYEDGSPCQVDDYPVTECLRTGQRAGPLTIGVRRPDGLISWAVFTAIPMIDHKTQQVLGAVVTFIDITERKQFEQRQQLFIREMDHRIRNNLSSLLTLIDMSRRKATDVNAFATSISGQVKAIAAVHSLIGDAHRRTLRNIIHAITPGDHIGKVQARGEHVSIPARQVTPLAMVLHELMTNSLKYGALRSSAGAIGVDWIVERSGDATGSATGGADGATHVQMSWRESGGPALGDDPPEGAGTQLMRGLIKTELRGTLELSYPRDGAWHRIMITLDAPETDDTIPADQPAHAPNLAISP